MKLDVPVLNEDGSTKTVVEIDPAQAQVLLQFALNFLVATGLTAAYQIDVQEENPLAQMEIPFSD